MIGSTSTTTHSVIDINHPYYIQSFDNPGMMMMINLTLNESNYPQWSRSMKITLSSNTNLGFVDGTCVKPTANSILIQNWTRCNHMVA